MGSRSTDIYKWRFILKSSNTREILLNPHAISRGGLIH